MDKTTGLCVINRGESRFRRLVFAGVRIVKCAVFIRRFIDILLLHFYGIKTQGGMSL